MTGLVRVNGVPAFVPSVDESADGGDEVGDAGEGAASERLARDDPEEHFVEVGGVEGFGFISVNRLNKGRDQRQRDLDDFGRARLNQVETWRDVPDRDIRGVAEAVVKIAKTTTGRAIGAAAQQVVRASIA
jgi:hypothetical protein